MALHSGQRGAARSHRQMQFRWKRCPQASCCVVSARGSTGAWHMQHVVSESTHEVGYHELSAVSLSGHDPLHKTVAQLCHPGVYVCAGYNMAAMTVWTPRDGDDNRWWAGDAGEGGTEGWLADKVVAIDGHMVLASAQETPSWYLTGRCRLRIWDVLYGFVGHIDCSGAEVALSSPEPGCALVACTHWAQPHTPVGGRLEVWDVHEQALLFAADTGARVPRGAAALGGGLVVACGHWEGGGLAVWSLATPRQEVAARQISRHWRRAISDPQRALCRKVLARVYSE